MAGTEHVRELADELCAALGAVRGQVRGHFLGPTPTRGAAAPEVIARLRQQPVSVRLEVVDELLRRADQRAFEVLGLLAGELADPDPRVRWAIANGLWRLPAPEAVLLLKRIATSDPDEMVRACAVEALGARAMAAYEAKAGPEMATPLQLIRTRGAVRTRGASPVREASPEAQEILEALYQLREEVPCGEVQRAADMVLRQLGE